MDNMDYEKLYNEAIEFFQKTLDDNSLINETKRDTLIGVIAYIAILVPIGIFLGGGH